MSSTDGCVRCGTIRPTKAGVPFVCWTGPTPFMCEPCQLEYAYATIAMRMAEIPNSAMRAFLQRSHSRTWMKEGGIELPPHFDGYEVEGYGLVLDGVPPRGKLPVYQGYGHDRTVVNCLWLWQWRIYFPNGITYLEAEWVPREAYDRGGVRAAIYNWPHLLDPEERRAFNRLSWTATDLLNTIARPGGRTAGSGQHGDRDSFFTAAVQIAAQVLREGRELNKIAVAEHLYPHSTRQSQSQQFRRDCKDVHGVTWEEITAAAARAVLDEG